MDRLDEDRVPSPSLTGSYSSDDGDYVDDLVYEHPSIVAQETHVDNSEEHPLAPNHHEEWPVDPPVVSKRRVWSGEHDHTLVDDRVAKVEAKVDTLRSDFDEVKS